VEHFLATWGYLALFLATFISSMGIPIGSEIAIAYAGALASGEVLTNSHDHLSLALVIVVAVLGELCGSAAGYAIGRFGGRPLVDRVGRYVLLTKKDLDRAEAWFDGKGESVVLFGRLVPLVRSFISLAAGLAEMALGKFSVMTVIGCTIWCGALAGIGYSLGSSWHHVITAFSWAGYLALALVVVAIVLVLVHRLTTVREERARHSPAAARARAAAPERRLVASTENPPRDAPPAAKRVASAEDPT
jgi:membrane protein DedA with SNARE-associated domain